MSGREMSSAHDLLSLARERQAEVVAFLQDLVRIPSVNGRDDELGVAARVAEEAGRLGLPARLIEAQVGRPNVLVEWGEGARGFALIGHMDTVAADGMTVVATRPGWQLMESCPPELRYSEEKAAHMRECNEANPDVDQGMLRDMYADRVKGAA